MHTKLFDRMIFFILCLLSTTPTLAETMFDEASGQLFVPILRVSDTEAYAATFNLLSSDPLVWGLASAELTTNNSRTDATYDAASGKLTVPEINVGGQLYDLDFNVTTDCEADACLSPRVSSLVDRGRSGAQVFTTVASTGSTYTCATCHAISETDGFAADGIRRPGHPLLNATRRPSFKNGVLDKLLDAVNICRTEWMNTTAWVETDQEWINLKNWLDDQATEEVTEAVTIEIVAPATNLSGGAETAGRELFNKRCVVCHGEDGLGTERAPKISGIGLQADYISRRVRTGGRVDSAVYPNLTGGVMPFWGADRLSDGELADVIAYLRSGEVDPVDMGGDTSTNPSGCTSNHPNVGQSARLTTRFHNVSGNVTVVDDCTLQITNFSYDGGGIDVHVYAGTNRRFLPRDGGFSLLGGLLGTAYNDSTLTITLPAGVTLDHFNSIAIWCVPVGLSFGEAQFGQGT